MLCKLTEGLSAFSSFCLHYTIGLLRILFVLTNNLYCIPTYAFWMLTFYPVKVFISPELYWYIEGRLFHWLLSMVSLWSYTAGYHIVESGDRIEYVIDKECLVLVNHQSTSDVPLLMAAFNARKDLLPNLTWIMDRLFKYTNFGVVSSIHGDFFISAGRTQRDQTVKDLTKYLHDTFVPCHRKWLVLFPEGGFLRKRKAASQRYAAKENLPNFEHVTIPRMGAVQAILDTIGPSSRSQANGNGAAAIHDNNHSKSNGISKNTANSNPNNNVEKTSPSTLKYIIDMTIAYPNGEPLDLGVIVTGLRKPCNTHFHYKIYPIDTVPIEPAKFQDWLIARFAEKEDLMKAYYRSCVWDDNLPGGTLGSSGLTNGHSETKWKFSAPTTLTQDVVRIGLLHLFFIVSTYFHWTLVSCIGQRLSSLVF